MRCARAGASQRRARVCAHIRCDYVCVCVCASAVWRFMLHGSRMACGACVRACTIMFTHHYGLISTLSHMQNRTCAHTLQIKYIIDDDDDARPRWLDGWFYGACSCVSLLRGAASEQLYTFGVCVCGSACGSFIFHFISAIRVPRLCVECVTHTHCSHIA